MRNQTPPFGLAGPPKAPVIPTPASLPDEIRRRMPATGAPAEWACLEADMRRSVRFFRSRMLRRGDRP